MEMLLNALALLGGILVGAFIVGEMAAAVYIYRNRATLLPRIRQFFGSDTQHATLVRVNELNDTLQRLERKVNYIGRHTQFERQTLRRMGILKEEGSSTALRGANPNDAGLLRRS
jgi:hypothetical protein